jgi:hypothetical protein
MRFAFFQLITLSVVASAFGGMVTDLLRPLQFDMHHTAVY